MTIFTDMSGNVVHFLAFSLLTVGLFYVLPRRVRPHFLLSIGIVFYLLCDWKMAIVLAADVLWTWLCALKIAKTRKKGWLIAGIVPLVAVLSFFKYNAFFLSGLEKILAACGFGIQGGILKLLMPLGISYYIFKSVSYLADVYKGKTDAKTGLFSYALYVTFFAEILCGPISRFDDFYSGMEAGLTYSKEKMQQGFYLVVKGLFMKAVIADRLAGYVADVFAKPQSFTALTLWAGAFFYTVQLYCDFAGYSSIAVGITQMFGMHYQENFNRPYFAENIREFWDRWHISLSTWLRDYIYFPLGGSRCAKWRAKLNVLIVFLVSGFWHGSGLNFLLWGLYHGVATVLTPRRKERRKGILHGLSVFGNFLVVMLGWVLFGASSLGTAFTYYKGMALNWSLSVGAIQDTILPFTNDNTAPAFFLTVMAFIVILFLRELYEERKKLSVRETPCFAWQTFLLTAVLLFGNFGASGFLYANF